jgi:large subunit ribosomal protein L30
VKKITVTLRKSLIGRSEKLRRVVRALGLRKINHSVTHDDTPSIRGMIHKTSHLVEVSEK